MARPAQPDNPARGAIPANRPRLRAEAPCRELPPDSDADDEAFVGGDLAYTHDKQWNTSQRNPPPREEVAGRRPAGPDSCHRTRLDHWDAEDRYRRLFFCQTEAVAIFVFTTEVANRGLYAVNCRSNHMPVVIAAPARPIEVPQEHFKAWCSRLLREHERLGPAAARENWWTDLAGVVPPSGGCAVRASGSGGRRRSDR